MVSEEEVDGDYKLQLRDEVLAHGEAFASQVVDCSLDADCVAAGPSSIDYRQFRAAARKTVAVRLYKECGGDVFQVQVDSLVEAQTVQYAIRELMHRLPCAAVRILTPHECSAVSVTDDAGRLALLQSSLDKYSHTFAVLHSENPMHYTLLERTVSGGSSQLRYWDSLEKPSASAAAMAQCLVDKMQWGVQAPKPCNSRFQSDGWSCGLFCVQFLEEGVRRARNEPIHVAAVQLTSIVARISRWIKAVTDAVPAEAKAVVKASAPSASEDPVPIEDKVKAKSAASTAKGVRATPSDPYKISHVPDEAFTLEMAQAAAKVHSKCRFAGCSLCMRQFFVPKAVLKATSRAASVSVGAAVSSCPAEENSS